MMRIFEIIGVSVKKLILLSTVCTSNMVSFFWGVINCVSLKVHYGSRLLRSYMAEVWVNIWVETKG